MHTGERWAPKLVIIPWWMHSCCWEVSDSPWCS